MRNSILIKLLIIVFFVSVVIFGLALGIISRQAKKSAQDDAISLTDTYAKQYAQQVTSKLNIDIGISRTLANTFLKYQNFSVEERNRFYINTLKNVYENNPGYLAVWTSLELNAYKPNFYDVNGRAKIEVFDIDNQTVVNRDTLDIGTTDDNSLYARLKEMAKEIVVDPYFYSYTDASGDSILETSVCVPIIENEQFIGLSGVDIPLTKYQKLISTIHPFDNGYAFLISNNGTIIGHPDKKHVGKKFRDVFPNAEANYKIHEKIKTGQHFSFKTVLQENDKNNYMSFVPIVLGKSPAPWSLAVVAPIDEIMANSDENIELALIVGVVGIALIMLVVLFVARTISKPLRKIVTVLNDLAKGNIDKSKKLSVKSKDEIGRIRLAVNNLIDSFQRTAKFASQIGEGNLDAEIKRLSDNDVLGNSLIEMRKSLLIAKEQDEKRRIEAENRNWSAQGIAKFGELIRSNTDNMEEFGYMIISNLVKYLDAQIGAFYIINDNDKEDKFIELIATYAYSKRKYREERIEIGINLIGRCVQEEETIFMTDIPKDYIKINSGLGDENPTSLLIVPLKFNEEIFGVVEMASFKVFQPFEIEFVEKVGESIASTISIVKMNMRTAQLLKESEERSKEFQEQEEELKQTIDMMKNNEEEIARENQNLRQELAEAEEKIQQLSTSITDE